MSPSFFLVAVWVDTSKDQMFKKFSPCHNLEEISDTEMYQSKLVVSDPDWLESLKKCSPSVRKAIFGHLKHNVIKSSSPHLVHMLQTLEDIYDMLCTEGDT